MKFKVKNKSGATEFLWDGAANKVVLESENGILDTEDPKLIERLKSEGYEETDGILAVDPIKQPEQKEKPKLGRPKGRS